MKTKTLLLVFIHGFKGSDNTFEKFPEHLRVLVSNALPNIRVVEVTYPQYETRGTLSDCVAGFKEWVQNKVIDLEVEAETPSPTVDPSVHVVLVGHSMGGIVAAETLLSVARDQPLPPSSSSMPRSSSRNQASINTTSTGTQSAQNSNTNLPLPTQNQRATSAPPKPKPAAESKPSKASKPKSQPTSDPDKGTSEIDDDTPTFFFPFIQGILAFDTPFLGIHPGVVAHGAEAHYNSASAALNAYNSASQIFGGGSKAPQAAANSSRALPAATAKTSGGWGRYAMFAGGAAALAAAGGAAWMGRSQLSEGWSWVGSHLEFVGCLARGAELTQRVDAVGKLSQRNKIGFADFYTKLGEDEGKTHYAGQLLGEERTFCVVPKDAKRPREKEDSGAESPTKKRKTSSGSSSGSGSSAGEATAKGMWIECVNKKAGDEISAHRAMFTPKDNPGYYSMSERAKKTVVSWVDKAWYDTSEPDPDDVEDLLDEQGEEDATDGAKAH